MKKIIIGITSGIAAYKIGDLVELFKKDKQSVELILTSSAQKMLGSDSKKLFPQTKIYTDLFPSDFSYQNVLHKREVEHIQVSDSASLLVIAPATANTIAKLAHGIADDFLTTVALATTAPILVCPSMNVHMWEHPATQENISILQKRGVHILHPDSGALACGYTGVGRLPDIEKIKNEMEKILTISHLFHNKKILITAGGTSIPIDSVRMITNRASGKMGKALAEMAYQQDAAVILLRAKNAVPAGSNIRQEVFETPDDLYKLIKKYAKGVDVIFHTAAVSDFAPKKKFSSKLDSSKPFTLDLVPQQKIINEIKKINPNVFLVAFKAVYGTPRDNSAIQKLFNDSKTDVIIANDISKSDRGFGSDTNEVVIFQKNKKPVTIGLVSKIEIAQKILWTTCSNN